MRLVVKAVIFDFDGTLIDSLDAFIAAATQLSGRFGYSADQDIASLRKKGPLEILRGELRWSWLKIVLYIRAMRPLVHAETRKRPFIRGMKAVLRALQKRYVVGILTSNSKAVVEEVLARERIGVSFIKGGTAVFGKHRALKRLLKRLRLKPSDVIYVGDELRDIKACRRAGVRIAAVTWGLNAEEALAAAKPDFLIRTPKELLTIVK